MDEKDSFRSRTKYEYFIFPRLIPVLRHPLPQTLRKISHTRTDYCPVPSDGSPDRRPCSVANWCFPQNFGKRANVFRRLMRLVSVRLPGPKKRSTRQFNCSPYSGLYIFTILILMSRNLIVFRPALLFKKPVDPCLRKCPSGLRGDWP